MGIFLIEKIAGVKPGTYERQPEQTYLKYVWNIGINCLDQFIPDNPLTMTEKGFKSNTKKHLKQIVVDSITIDSPEAVAYHIEKFLISFFQKAIESFDEEKTVKEIITQEQTIQKKLGPNLLKSEYGYVKFPYLSYGYYGYENYFMAYLLYPEIIEKHFSIQADYVFITKQQPEQ